MPRGELEQLARAALPSADARARPPAVEPARAFAFLPLNARAPKPRSRGLTEIRGPYYSAVGRGYLEDLLDAAGDAVDALKFAGGSFAVMRRDAVQGIIEVCHEHDVRVSTGGFVERVLGWGPRMVERYLEECRVLGFDIVEVSAGFVALPDDDFVALVRAVAEHGLEPRAEVGIQWGAGGASASAALEAAGMRDPALAVALAQRCLEAGAPLVMVESEGITENVRAWRTDVVASLAAEVGLPKLVFEAAEPDVFAWYVKTFGPEVNLFVDHSQLLQLECLRRGAWGTNDTWGRIARFAADGGGAP